MTVDIGCQNGEKRIRFFESSFIGQQIIGRILCCGLRDQAIGSCIRLGCFRLFCRCIGCIFSSQYLFSFNDSTGFFIGCLQIRKEISVIEGFIELQRCCSLQQFSYPLSIFNTRKFDHDTTGDICFTDIRLCYTETVDTCTQNIEGIVDCSFGFLTDNV